RVAAIDCGHRRAVRRVSLSSDGQVLAAATVDGVGVWTVPDGKPVSVVAAGDADVFRLLPAGDRLATAGRSGAVRVWTVASGREELTLFGHVGAVTGLGVSPDGRTLVSGGATGEVKFWDVRTGAELVGLRRHSTPVTVVEFSAAGNLLVTAGAGQVAVWDARE